MLLHRCGVAVRAACEACGSPHARYQQLGVADAGGGDGDDDGNGAVLVPRAATETGRRAATACVGQRRHYCTRRCARAHFLAQAAGWHGVAQPAASFVPRTQPLVRFSVAQLDAARVRQFVDLLNDTTDEAKTARAVALFTGWLSLPRVRVAFFDAVPPSGGGGGGGGDGDLVVRSVTIDGREVQLETPSRAIGAVRYAATNGEIIFINRRIQPAAFQAQVGLRFLRFALPPGITHYAAIVAHELGHVAHIAPAARAALYGATWANYVERRRGAMPSPTELDEFVEEVADRFAIDVFSLLQ